MLNNTTKKAGLDLSAIEARAAAATPGPWPLEREELDEEFTDEEQETAQFSQIGPWHIQGHDGLYGHPLALVKTDEEHYEADAAFIVAARDDVPALCAEVRRLLEMAREGWSMALALAVLSGESTNEQKANEKLAHLRDVEAPR